MPQIVVFEIPRWAGGGKIGPQRRLGPILEPLQLLEGSWKALGGLLERSWTLLERSWEALGAHFRKQLREPTSGPRPWGGVGEG